MYMYMYMYVCVELCVYIYIYILYRLANTIHTQQLIMINIAPFWSYFPNKFSFSLALSLSLSLSLSSARALSLSLALSLPRPVVVLPDMAFLVTFSHLSSVTGLPSSPPLSPTHIHIESFIIRKRYPELIKLYCLLFFYYFL